MADFSSKGDAPFPAAAPAVQKRTGPNISSSWVIMVLSGLIAMVVFLFATNKATDKVTVAMANEDLSAGAQITSGSFRPVDVTLASPQLNRLVLWADRNLYIGYTTAGPIAKGDLIAKAQVRKETTANGLNAMSIPVVKTRAVGGELAIGDRVDILDDSNATYAARDLEVIAVKDGTSGGALAAGEGFHIIVALDPDEAIAVGKTISNGKLDVIRTTGGSSPSHNSNSASNFNGTTTTSPSTTSTTKKS